MSGFQSPNYTQTPNDFFVMIPDMSEAELRVTLVMIRETFGFHREGFKMGLNKLADAAGLSRNGAKDGAEAAEKRGTFYRTNPDSLGEAEWSLAVDPSPSDHLHGQPVTTPPSPSEVQVRVKERIKKPEKKGDLIDGMLFFGKQAQDQQVDKVEEVIQHLERDLHVNIARSLNNQQVAKRIIKDGRSINKWVTWVMAEEWRATHTYLYADLEKVWRDWPQAFVKQTDESRPEYKIFRAEEEDKGKNYVPVPDRRPRINP